MTDQTPEPTAPDAPAAPRLADVLDAQIPAAAAAPPPTAPPGPWETVVAGHRDNATPEGDQILAEIRQANSRGAVVTDLAGQPVSDDHTWKEER